MPTVRFQSGAAGSQSFVGEAAGFFVITLTLSHPSDVPVTVAVRPFAAGVDGADMNLGDYTVTFAPGETTATYRAQIYNDAIDETDENVHFEIVSSTNATIDLSSTDAYRIPGRILDDDVPSGPTVRFVSGAQGSQSFLGEGAGSFAITLVLSQASSVPVTVVVRPFASGVDGADMDLRDYTLTFAPGETTATYRAQIHDDAIDEPDENMFFEIVSATNATIDLSASDAYRILGRILDNDVPAGPTVRFAVGAQGSQSFTSEGAGFFAIGLVLSQAATVPVTVTVRPFAAAVDGADMDLRDYTVTFAPGETSATYRAQIYNDSVDETDENVFFELVAVTNATVDLSSLDAYRILGRIIDNDLPPITGTSGPDQLTGSAADDTIDGLGGDDTINGGGGNDAIDGGAGNDIVRGEDGDDRTSGGAGNDIFLEGGGNDFLDGGDGIDTAIYSGLFRSYDVQVSGASGSVAGGPAGGTDTLASIERIQFRDGKFVFDADGVAAQVARLYDATLQRAPDQAGLDLWVDYLEDQGATLKDVANGFLGSAEFQARTGNLSNADYVEFLYQNALRRASDPDGKAGWIQYLESGGGDRADLLIGFSESTEHRGLTADLVARGFFNTDDAYQAVALLYDSFAGRLPDEQGLIGWAEALKSGATLSQVAEGFANSAEFQNLTAGMSHDELVEFMYRNTLDRGSEPGERAGWVNALDAGMSDADLLIGFSQSFEHFYLLGNHITNGVDYL